MCTSWSKYNKIFMGDDLSKASPNQLHIKFIKVIYTFETSLNQKTQNKQINTVFIFQYRRKFPFPQESQLKTGIDSLARLQIKLNIRLSIIKKYRLNSLYFSYC